MSCQVATPLEQGFDTASDNVWSGSPARLQLPLLDPQATCFFLS